MARLRRQAHGTGKHHPAVLAAKEQRKKAAENRKTTKVEAKARSKGEHGRITPGNAKKLVGVARVLGPAVVPYLFRAVGLARDRYDRARARQLGVAVEDIGQYTGHGAALHARIAGDHRALEDLRQLTKQQDAEQRVRTNQFIERANTRLQQLTSAVRTAERIPAGRRRATHQAIAAELERVEQELFDWFGV